MLSVDNRTSVLSAAEVDSYGDISLYRPVAQRFHGEYPTRGGRTEAGDSTGSRERTYEELVLDNADNNTDVVRTNENMRIRESPNENQRFRSSDDNYRQSPSGSFSLDMYMSDSSRGPKSLSLPTSGTFPQTIRTTSTACCSPSSSDCWTQLCCDGKDRSTTSITSLISSRDRGEMDLDSCRQRNCSLSDERTPKLTLAIYNEDRSEHSVTIDATTTVADVCDQMMKKTHAKHDPSWSIVEYLGKNQFERSLEDHELIYRIYESWKTTSGSSAGESSSTFKGASSPSSSGNSGGTSLNKFYLRKDFNKYELFRSPNQYFPESMLDVDLPKDDPTGLLTRYERYKNLLLQNLLTNQTMPDIQAYVHIREGKRWKKQFCVLRGSGLYYSTKGNSKDPQNLALISHLTDVNIFAALNAKKLYGAPSQHSFCLRSCNNGDSGGGGDGKSFKLFCVEDDHSRLCWITGMRFVKYGSQLRENFKLRLKCDERMLDSDNRAHQQDSDWCARNRVAMDFSGERGRVVADPNEALSIAFEEGHNWRIRAARTVNGSPSNRGSPLSSSPVRDSSTLYRPAPVTQAQLHLTQSWFHNNATRDEAQTLIERQGLADGVFLLRESQSMPGVVVLSFAHNAKVKHCTINKMECGGQSFYTLDGGVTKFMDLIQLVDFYQLNAGALPTPLTHYVTRLM